MNDELVFWCLDMFHEAFPRTFADFLHLFRLSSPHSGNIFFYHVVTIINLGQEGETPAYMFRLIKIVNLHENRGLWRNFLAVATLT